MSNANSKTKTLANSDTKSSESTPIPADIDSQIIIESVDSSEVQRNITRTVDRLNKDYQHLVICGKNLIIRMISRTYGTGLEPEFFKPSELKQFHSHDAPVLVGYSKRDGEPKYLNPAVVWLNDKNANFIKGGLDFNPACQPLSRTDKNRFNLWQGLAIKPKKGLHNQVDLYLAHVLDVICNGNKSHFKYFMQVAAHAVQKPYEKPSVATVMKSAEGTGKGTAVDPLLTIFGAHGIATSNENDIVGRFNSVLENRIFVFFDEAFTSGKRASGTMNTLISESYHRIERKGIDGGFVPNLMRIFIASNEEIPVPVSMSARRYFFLAVSEHRIGDSDYFEKLSFCRSTSPNHKAFCEALIYWLLEYDISDFTPYKAPVTNELIEQKLLNLEPVYQWIYHILDRGCVVANGGWPARLDNDSCYQHCSEWIHSNNLKMPRGSAEHAIGAAMTKVGMESKAQKVAGKVSRMRTFKTLQESRTLFEKYLKAEGFIEWSN